MKTSKLKNDTNKTNNELNKHGVRFVHQFHEFVDLHGEDQTLTIIQDLHKAGHIEFKDSELDYCDFMDKEHRWELTDEGKPIKPIGLNPFQKAIAQFVNTPETKLKMDKEDGMKQMKFQPGMTGEEHLKAVQNLMLNSNPPEKDEEFDPFQKEVDRFMNTPEVGKFIDQVLIDNPDIKNKLDS